MDKIQEIQNNIIHLFSNFANEISSKGKIFDQLLSKKSNAKDKSINPDNSLRAEPAFEIFQFPESYSYSPPYIVFIVGAGASKDLGFPLCNDFFNKDYIRQLKIVGSFFNADDQNLYEKYCDKKLNFEKLLFDYDTTSEGYTSLIRYYEHVLLAAETYWGTADFHVENGGWWNFIYHYFSFLGYLQYLTGKGNRPVVITFNHDMVIENCLLWSGFNYGRFTELMYNKAHYPKFPEFGLDFPLLKLHGSFNYMLCKKCGKVWCAADYLWEKKEKLNCINCKNGKFQALYLPPIYNKDISPFMISWKEAKQYLTLAEEIHIYGYSMPKYDREAKNLLLNINPNAPIYLVDKYAENTITNYNILPNTKYILSKSFREFCFDIFSLGYPYNEFNKL